MYFIKKEYLDSDGREVWNLVVEHVKAHKSFTSVTGIVYYANFVGSCIYFKGGSGNKRSHRGEYLTAKDFIAAYDIIKTLDTINVGQIKPYIKRQQTPFFGLLVCAGIIEIV